MNTWQVYVAMVLAGDSQTMAAERTGIAQASISRWLSGKKEPTEAAQVAKFAKAYGREVLEAFVAAEWLSVDDVHAGMSKASYAFLADVFEAVNEIADRDLANAVAVWPDEDVDEPSHKNALPSLAEERRRRRNKMSEMESEAARNEDGDE